MNIESNIRVAMMVACKLAPADLNGQRQVIDTGQALGIFSNQAADIAKHRILIAAHVVRSRHPTGASLHATIARYLRDTDRNMRPLLRAIWHGRNAIQLRRRFGRPAWWIAYDDRRTCPKRADRIF